jgi:hypothetical protein
MAAKEAFLHIRIHDEHERERLPGMLDVVEVGGAGVTYSVADGFNYKLELPAGETARDIEVVIRYRGFNELRQWYKLDGKLRLTPFGPGRARGYELTCMTLLRTRGGQQGARSPFVHTLSVQLFPYREHVAVIGANYWEGAATREPDAHQSDLDFAGYAKTYAMHLYYSNRLGASSPCTVMDCQRGVVERWMLYSKKGLSSKAPPEWKPQTLLLKKEPAPTWSNPGGAQKFREWRDGLMDGTVDATKLLGAVDVYMYLADPSKTPPGTVIDLGIFSHAWPRAPLLFNTDGGRKRSDDLDFQGSDFSPPYVDAWSTLKAAFAADAEVRIWGCFAQDMHKSMAKYIGEGQKGIFKWRHKKTRKLIKRSRFDVLSMLRHAMKTSYTQKIATFLSVVAWGAPPGTGSEHIDYRKLRKIAKSLRKEIKSGDIMYVPATYVPPTRGESSRRRAYMLPELGSREFDAFGYIKYVP